jgi:hypothetical protein
MPHGRKPGSECVHNDRRQIHDQTLCLQESPLPGPTGLGDFFSNARHTFDDFLSGLDKQVEHASSVAIGHGKSALLTVLDLVPFKQSSPIATALLKHYVERSGDKYELDVIPIEWQDWIVKATHARPGVYKDLSPYNSGLYDLRNSLGHFDVTVEKRADGKKTYIISDVYQFAATPHDKQQRGRHGFPLGSLSAWEIKALQQTLPSTKYANPGGFTERWEVRTVGKETFLFIPQQYLVEQGTPFPVTGTFVR